MNSKLEQFAHDEAMFQEVKDALLNRINLKESEISEEGLSNELLGEKVRGVIVARKLIKQAFGDIARLRQQQAKEISKDNPAV